MVDRTRDFYSSYFFVFPPLLLTGSKAQYINFISIRVVYMMDTHKFVCYNRSEEEEEEEKNHNLNMEYKKKKKKGRT